MWSAPITRPDGGEFFARNGVLFLSVDDVRSNMAQLIKAEPFLGTLAADPTLRGVLGAVSQSLEGVRHEKTTLEDLRPALSAIAEALERVEQGRTSGFLLASAALRASRRSGRIFGGSSISSLCSIMAIWSQGARRPRPSGRRSRNLA